MKKHLLAAIFVLGALSGAACQAFAEPLEGMILSIDSKDQVLLVAPSGAGDSNPQVSVSVSEFIKNNGSAALNGLDVGKTVSMTVGHAPDGNWQLVSIAKPDLTVPTTAEGDNYLEKKGPAEPSEIVRHLKRLFKRSS